MFLEVDARFDYFDPFALEKLLLQRGVRFADEDLSASAKNAMPRNPLALRRGAHGSAGAASAAAKVQGSSEGSIC